MECAAPGHVSTGRYRQQCGDSAASDAGLPHAEGPGDRATPHRSELRGYLRLPPDAERLAGRSKQSGTSSSRGGWRDTPEIPVEVHVEPEARDDGCTEECAHACR